MKNIKLLFILSIGVFINSCDLNENPPFLDNTVYASLQSARAAMDGIYQSLTTYGAQEQRLFAINGFSGLFVTRKNGGNNRNNVNNANLFSLKPIQDQDSENMWGGLYQAIARANSAILNIEIYDNPTTNDEIGFNDIAGHAYFVRAWSYFSLVRLWGDIPIWLDLPSSGNTDKAKSPTKDVYAQIIADAQQAKQLLNGSAGTGYPSQYAANMLLAKVYMTMATAASEVVVDPSANYWQLAYEEAIKVYGQFTLNVDYTELFTVGGENSSESIFELQISQDASNSQMGRNFTPWKYKAAQHFGWFSVHADVHDYHVATYPDDPRIAGTYLSEYERADNGASVKVYPANAARAAFNNAHPYLFKFAEKDKSHTNQYNSQNVIIYRYADLLLMLAEISNELQNGQELGFVSEVLARVGQVPHAGYSGGQEAFRDAIMDEYRFELIGEGEDAHNNRRRGFDYFLKNTIERHNNNPIYDPAVDLELSTDENEVMILPIPLIEINTNNLIDG